ncbi:hypothetical protein HPB50_014837 [Hyalomma asiaticum]|uniref:Uncharacterized protein n=1 Tax=Hyalomma asiaticum TaxID=266040 RepID=A0ACB7SUM0_HYAAI|nr:hypothetical protein HPB50_014837 [Hyalomma asiaticum]
MDPPAKRKLFGKAAIAVTGCSAVGILAVAVPFLSPALRKICLPYLPATDAQVRNVSSLLRRRRRCSAVVDLGSGDGRIVLEASRLGFAVCVGVELNPWLVAYSRLRALGTTSARFVRADLWDLTLTPFDVVVVFGVQQMMAPLERKFVHQLRPGSWVLACRFPLPTLKPDETCGSGVDTVWLYRMAGSLPSSSTT